jgi:hypothetical protein
MNEMKILIASVEETSPKAFAILASIIFCEKSQIWKNPVKGLIKPLSKNNIAKFMPGTA